jgi:hypothetical protein
MDSNKVMHEARGTFTAMNALRALKLAGVANEPLKKIVLKWGCNLLDLGLWKISHFDAGKRLR